MFSKLFNKNTLPATEDVMVFRSDYSDDAKWEKLKMEITTPHPQFGFLANVVFYENKKFDGFSLDKLLPKLSTKYKHSIIFIADKTTFTHKDSPLICVDLLDQPGQYLLIIPSELWGIENNLSISNMEFQEFANYVDEEHIFRGFPHK